MTDYDTPLPHHTETPPRKQQPVPYVEQVKIIRPADPEKLAALRAHKKNITKRRVDAGLSPKGNRVWEKFGGIK